MRTTPDLAKWGDAAAKETREVLRPALPTLRDLRLERSGAGETIGPVGVSKLLVPWLLHLTLQQLRDRVGVLSGVDIPVSSPVLTWSFASDQRDENQ
jgi:hypothetical protein